MSLQNPPPTYAPFQISGGPDGIIINPIWMSWLIGLNDNVTNLINIVGPAGPSGAAGAPGAAGSGGVGFDTNDNDFWFQGIPGVPGSAGLTGLSGPPGMDGEAGDDGPPGATGATGVPGAAGNPGYSIGDPFNTTDSIDIPFEALSSAGINTSVGTLTAAGLTVTGSITPSQTAGIIGTTTNNNANAGSVGEFPTPTDLTGVALTSAISANTSSHVLGPGDWTVSGVIDFLPAAGTPPTLLIAGVGTTSATLGAVGTYTQLAATFATGARQVIITPPRRILVATGTTQTVYLVGFAVFSVSTCAASGYLHIRRSR